MNVTLRISLGAWKIFYEKIFTLFSNESLFLSTAIYRETAVKKHLFALCTFPSNGVKGKRTSAATYYLLGRVQNNADGRVADRSYVYVYEAISTKY